MALVLSSLAVPSMTVLTGGRTFAATLPGAEAIPFVGTSGVFDPLKVLPETKEEVLMFREAELAHSRVAMVGALGYLVQSHFTPLFEWDIIGADGHTLPVIRHLDVVLQDPAGQSACAFLLGAIFFSEIFRARTGWVEPDVAYKTLRADYEPGALGFDPLNMMPTDEAGMKAMQEKELRNGRLAMLAIAGMTVQELSTGQQLF